MISEIPPNSDEPSSTNPAEEPLIQTAGKDGLMKRLKYLVTGKQKPDATLREAIEEYIEEPENFTSDSISTHERILLSNLLKLRDEKVQDVMIPRADIIAIEVSATKEDLFALLADKQVSRLPVYRETLDEVLGTVHIKDILEALAQGKQPVIKNMMRDIPIVSPALPVLDLLLKMRQTRRHMALVVDEYGGIDGLVTIGDVIENIIGEIDDEHDALAEPQMTKGPDGSVIADARLSIEEFENACGTLLSEEERLECDTLGGLVFATAGRVPARGEIIAHPTGMVFEILEADPRRIGTVKIQKIPMMPSEEQNRAAE
jgi:magnesium and cobalt transporter